MKIKALSRSVSEYNPPGTEVVKQPRNLDPGAHPFERAREYTKALNAVKLERMHAAPFVAELGQGHVDGVYTMAKDPNSLQRFASASGDGAVKVFDMTSRDEVWQTKSAHENIVRSVCWTKDQRLLSAASDKTIKLWDPYNTPSESAPISSWLGNSGFTDLSMHRSRNVFAASSSSSSVAIYDLERHNAAPDVLGWPNSVDTINAVAFNQVETSVLAACGLDRSIVLFDLRTSMPLTRTTLNFACNAISWNPMEAFNFAVGSEDHNIYIFDMRKFDRALNVLKDHVASVMSVEFSPTGQELVSGSYDRTIRLWNRDQGHSRDIYHTKRMQRVFSTMFTPDSKYVLSGSDDGNVRLWRTNASERSGIKSARHRQALEYNNALIERFSHMPEVRRIKRHRHIPTVVKKAGEIKAQELKSIKRREENERRHTKKQFQKRRSEREKMVLAREKVDFFQVAESAYEEQCRFCYVIYYSLLAMGCDVQIRGYSVLSLHAKPNAPFYVLWDDARVGRSVVEVFREKDSSCLLDMLGSATPLREDIRDPRLYDEIRQLLNECEKKHPACSQVTGELPRRLLHIGSAACPDLRVTASFPEDARYIALSHCWGPDAPFTTTWVTLTQREEGIEWNDLPRTFQDAITVARQLDVEYMWIDSLCIIQDDEDDWAVESLKMGFIYERAYLTVAAATAAGDRQGFLGGSPGREHFASRTIDMDPFGGPSGVQARRVFDVRATTLQDPLHTRAWTFQERIMPRRILTFSSAVFFECHTGARCETGSG
ncbi:hypothetical protein BN1723_002991, partial [Verticillium longisporum]